MIALEVLSGAYIAQVL